MSADTGEKNVCSWAAGTTTTDLSQPSWGQSWKLLWSQVSPHRSDGGSSGLWAGKARSTRKPQSYGRTLQSPRAVPVRGAVGRDGPILL